MTRTAVTVARHQVSPEEVEQAIQNDSFDVDFERVEGEERVTSIGRTDQGPFLVVVTTFRETRIRVVTAFPAPKDLIDFYVRQEGA